MPFQPLANPPTCIAALYAKNKANIESKCSLQLHKASTAPLPTQITPDVWILATPLSAPTATISLICPERPMEIIPIQWPLHVLKLPTACSATLANFYLPPRYETPILKCKCFFGLGKHTCYQRHCPTLSCLATYGKESQWLGPSTSRHPTIHTSTPDIWTSSEQFSIPNTVQHETISRFRHLLESVLPPRNIRFSFRISFTSWSYIVLLLLLLVSTCHTSTLTFTIR